MLTLVTFPKQGHIHMNLGGHRPALPTLREYFSSFRFSLPMAVDRFELLHAPAVSEVCL